MGFWQTIIHASTYTFTLHVHTVQRHSAWYYIGIIHGCQSWCNPLDVVTGWQVWETKSLFWSDPLWRRDWPIVYPHLPYSPCTSWPTLPTPWKGRNSSIVYKIYFLYFQPNFNFPFILPCGCTKLGPKNASKSHSFFWWSFGWNEKKFLPSIALTSVINVPHIPVGLIYGRSTFSASSRYKSLVYDEVCMSFTVCIVVWCNIEVDDGGAVSVKPDFNSGQTPYRIETRNRGIYVYTLSFTVSACLCMQYAISLSVMLFMLHS